MLTACAALAFFVGFGAVGVHAWRVLLRGSGARPAGPAEVGGRGRPRRP